MVVVGIDLGTITSRVAVCRDDRVCVLGRIPSCVAFDGDDVLIGDPALNNQQIAPQNVVYHSQRVIGRLNSDKQLIADRIRWPFKVNVTQKPRPYYQFNLNGKYTLKHPIEIPGLLTEHLISIAEDEEDSRVTGCVMAVPAMFNWAQRSAVSNAAEFAGIPHDKIQLINDSTAAAVGHCYVNQISKSNIIVFDLGGGCLSISVIQIVNGEYHVMFTTGSDHLGSEDIAYRLFDQFAAEFEERHAKNVKECKVASQVLLNECRRLLENLKDDNEVLVTDLLPNLTFRTRITKARVDELWADYFDIIKDMYFEAVTVALKLKNSYKVEVLAIGGANRLPRIQSLIEYSIKKSRKRLIMSLATNYTSDAVVLGSAVVAARKVKVQEVLTQTATVRIEDSGSFVVISPKGTRLPYSKCIVVKGIRSQTSVTLDLSDEWQSYVRQVCVRNFAPRDGKSPKAQFLVSFDASGCLSIQVIEINKRSRSGDLELEFIGNSENEKNDLIAEASRRRETPSCPIEPDRTNANSVVIGIDLGTTNSCVAVYQRGSVEILVNDQGDRTTPSVISFEETETLIGKSAKQMIPLNPENTIYDAKRLLGKRFQDATVTDDMKFWSFKVIDDNGKPAFDVVRNGKREILHAEQISSLLLARLREVAEMRLDKEVRIAGAVITVPAYFNAGQRRATKDAALIAGLNVLNIISEPTAAALAYGHLSVNKKQTILVYDLGGGTFDVTIVKIEGEEYDVIATAGDSHLGGQDFDQLMVSFFVDEILKKHDRDISRDKSALCTLREHCEQAKRALSEKHETTVRISRLQENFNFSSKLTRTTFERLCVKLFDETIVIVQRALSDAKLDRRNIDEVVLVGGSTRIPLVRQLLEKFFDGKQLSLSINPDEAVAYGAALKGAMINGDATLRNRFRLRDVTPLSLGIKSGLDGAMTMSLIATRRFHVPKVSRGRRPWTIRRLWTFKYSKANIT